MDARLVHKVRVLTGSSKTFVTSYRSARRHALQDINLHYLSHSNLKVDMSCILCHVAIFACDVLRGYDLLPITSYLCGRNGCVMCVEAKFTCPDMELRTGCGVRLCSQNCIYPQHGECRNFRNVVVTVAQCHGESLIFMCKICFLVSALCLR